MSENKKEPDPKKIITRRDFLKIVGASVLGAGASAIPKDLASAQENKPPEKGAFETSLSKLNSDDKEALNAALEEHLDENTRVVLLAQGVTLLDNIQYHIMERGAQESSISGGKKCGVHNERAIEALTRFAKDEIDLVLGAVKNVAMQTIEIQGVVYVISHLILTEFQPGKPVLVIVNNPEYATRPDASGGTAYRTNEANFNNKLTKYTQVHGENRRNVINKTRGWLSSDFIGNCLDERKKVEEKELVTIPQPVEINIPESAKIELLTAVATSILTLLGIRMRGDNNKLPGYGK